MKLQITCFIISYIGHVQQIFLGNVATSIMSIPGPCDHLGLEPEALGTAIAATWFQAVKIHPNDPAGNRFCNFPFAMFVDLSELGSL